MIKRIVFLLSINCFILFLGCRAFWRHVEDTTPLEASTLTAKYDVRDLVTMPKEMVEKLITELPKSAEPPLIAPMGIDNKTGRLADMDALEARIIQHLLDAKAARIVDVAARNKLLKEQGYQLSNCPSDKRVEIGKQLGARYMLIGFLSEVHTKSGREVRLSRKEDVFYQLTVKLVDLQTGELITQKMVERMRRASEPLIGW